MTVLDAYAVMAYLRDEAAAEEVSELLRSPTVLAVVNAAEVLDQLVRVYGRDADDVRADLALLSQAGMAVIAVSPDIGWRAGELRSLHYHRERRPVSLADCVAAATALTIEQPLATADPDLATLLRAEGGDVLGLPDSGGRRP